MNRQKTVTAETKAQAANILEQVSGTFVLLAAAPKPFSIEQYEELVRTKEEGLATAQELERHGEAFLPALAENAKSLRLLNRRIEEYESTHPADVAEFKAAMAKERS